MSTFIEAVANQESRTTNGMKARQSSANKNVDFFYSVGASRGKDIVPAFTGAFVEDRDLALRIAQWARDARGGAGERKIFRDILVQMEKTDTDAAMALLKKVPEIGRWDDVLVFTTTDLKVEAYALIAEALASGNGLCAKWMPRKGPKAAELRAALGMSPKQYRKTLVNLTKVVETQMCSKDWDNINFSHVPSLAASRYKKAFTRNTPKFAEYVAKLVKGDKTVKVNAGAVYPYDVLKGVISPWGRSTLGKTELDHVVAQWDALPDFVGDANILPLVDVSGSMTCAAGGARSKSETTCLDVAVSLGLYLADKNSGKFKDTSLTFSGTPELMTLKGNVVEKAHQMSTSKWAMNTDLNKAFEKILSVALANDVPQSEMPAVLLILSDMNCDQGCRYRDEVAQEMIERKYAEAGYTVPQIVYWNINSSDHVPVKLDKSGTALVSGFSPAIMKAILEANMDEFTPYGVMMKSIMNPRYDI